MTHDQIDTRLRGVEHEITRLSTLLTTNLQHLQEMADKHDRVLFGDLTEDNPGLKVHVDRLVQTDGRKRWALRATLGAAMAALGTALLNYFGFSR